MIQSGIGVLIVFFITFISRIQNSYKSGDGNWEYTLNEEGIRSISGVTDTDINWGIIIKTIELEEYILLEYKGIGFIPVPKEILTPEKTKWIKGKIRRK